MIPYNTDAPLYHPPIATVCLATLSVLLFFIVPPDPIDPNLAFAESDAAPPWVLTPIQQDWSAEDFIDPDAGGPENNRQRAAPANNEPGSEKVLRLRRPNLFLHFGTLNPLQWVTSPLLHKSFVELTVNLIGLWALGLVIEGKVGARRFLMLFFSIAVSHAAIVQTLLFFTATGSTSGLAPAVAGLLGVAVLWLPRNTFEVWFGSLLGAKEISILIYGFIQFALLLFAYTLSRDSVGEGVFPVLGLGLGLGLGYLWLHMGWVDGEGLDLVSAITGGQRRETQREQAEAEQAAQSLVQAALPNGRPSERTTSTTETDGRPLRERTHRRSKPKKPQGPQPSGAPLPPLQTGPDENNPLGFPQAHDPIHDVALLLEQDNLATALKLLEKIRIEGNKSQLSQVALNKLIRLMLAAKDYASVIPHMTEHIERFEEQREKLQLSLAKILLHQKRPNRALAVLGSMEGSKLDDDAKSNRSQLAAHAKQQIDDGVIEFSD